MFNFQRKPSRSRRQRSAGNIRALIALALLAVPGWQPEPAIAAGPAAPPPVAAAPAQSTPAPGVQKGAAATPTTQPQPQPASPPAPVSMSQPMPAAPQQTQWYLAGTSQVGSPLPVPPAFIIANRLYGAGDIDGALKKLGEVPASATYKATPYAPEAVYSIARIMRDRQHDDNNAIAEYNLLVNNYSNLQYPHKAVVPAERDALGLQIDKENRAAALNPVKYTPKPTTSFTDVLLYPWRLLEATGYIVVDFFIRLTGSQNFSYWVALLLISIVVRVGLWPLSVKQYRSMKEMQRIQPLIKDLQAKYGNDRQTFATKQMELYREHNVNPAAGCLPMLMQAPVMFYMYHAIWLYQYRFSHGTFLWINPTLHKAAPGLFGGNLADQDIVLLAIYAVSMYVTQRMMPVSDPQQAEAMKTNALLSSVIFFFIFQSYHSPSAFVLYWFFSNIVSMGVQLYIMRDRNVVQSPATVPGQLLDGDSTAVTRNGGSTKAALNGSDAAPAQASANGGTARGVIAPKVHPKKKRR